jgi:uncharacterized protein
MHRLRVQYAVRLASTTTASPQVPKKRLVLQYVYDATTAEELALKRAPLRPAHLAYIADNPAVLMGGAFSEPPMGAMIVFDGASKEIVENFARCDPYVTGKLVKGFTIREWVVVFDRTRLA